MSESAPAIIVDGISRRFGDRLALANVSWTVPAGSVVGLLGRNGAGKSTLLHAVLGLLRTDAGTIRLLGEDPRHLTDAVRGRLGWVPQQPVLPPHLLVSHLERSLEALYPRWDAPLVADLLRRFNIQRGVKVGSLSLGQAQSLALTMALGPHPDLLVLDEPAASLDPVARRTFHQAVLEVACDGQRTVVLSTHHTADLERLCDRLLIMVEGRVGYDGRLDDLQATTKRLRLRGTGLVSRPAWPEIRSWKSQGQAAVAMVHGDISVVVERCRARLGAEVEIEDLGLEDILVEIQP